jgi:hypothetical protein
MFVSYFILQMDRQGMGSDKVSRSGQPVASGNENECNP